ncbi:MAG: DMT family transporter [Deltaproteobacteria bacterium]|nr:DMT family transporter [Deltaproteobacteria bacterium]
MFRRSDLTASLPILASALLWGTLWIPLRALNESGEVAARLTAAGFALPLLVLVPFAIHRRSELRRGGLALAGAGLGLAISIALYSEALVRGSIARVVLLFYLMPVWTALLARLRLAQPITLRRLLSIGIGLAGLVVVYGPGGAAPATNTAGDWMALVAGIAWAATMVFFLPTPRQTALDRVVAQFAFLAPAYLLVRLVPGAHDAGAVAHAPAEAVALPLGWLLAFALAWMLPVVWLTIFGASRLEPGRAAVLFMLEIAVSLATAALLADEPFGAREGIGAALIAAAGLVELAPAGRPSTTGPRAR